MGGIIIAFKDYSVFKGIAASNWTGFENFERLFRSSAFLCVLKNNIIFAFMDMLVVFPTPIILAILLNEIEKTRKGKRLVQTIIISSSFYILGR